MQWVVPHTWARACFLALCLKCWWTVGGGCCLCDLEGVNTASDVFEVFRRSGVLTPSPFSASCQQFTLICILLERTANANKCLCENDTNQVFQLHVLSADVQASINVHVMSIDHFRFISLRATGRDIAHVTYPWGRHIQCWRHRDRTRWQLIGHIVTHTVFPLSVFDGRQIEACRREGGSGFRWIFPGNIRLHWACSWRKLAPHCMSQRFICIKEMGINLQDSWTENGGRGAHHPCLAHWDLFYEPQGDVPALAWEHSAWGYQSRRRLPLKEDCSSQDSYMAWALHLRKIQMMNSLLTQQKSHIFIKL